MSDVRTRVPAPRLLLGILAVVALLLGLVAPVQADETGRVRGAITEAGTGRPVKDVTVTVFDASWRQKTSFRTSGGYATPWLAPGTYHLRVSDRRPRWDVNARVSRDVKVVVRGGSTTIANISMARGASITGRISKGPAKRRVLAAGARVTAVTRDGTAYTVTADRRGGFAIGGLPAGSYSVFVWDARQKWVGRSLWVSGLRQGRNRDVRMALGTRAGTLVGDLYAGQSGVRSAVTLTLVNRTTGQWWVVRARGGAFTAKGLAPGRYDAIIPGVQGYAGARVHLAGSVRSGSTTATSARLTRVGGRLIGQVKDATSNEPLAGVKALLFDDNGTRIGSATSEADGVFRLGGTLPTKSCWLTLVLQVEQPIKGQKYHKLTVSGLGSKIGTVVSAAQPTVDGGPCRSVNAPSGGAFGLVRDGAPAPTPTPTPTPTTSPTPTATPSPTASPTPTVSPTPTAG
ncbi:MULTISPECIES: carboxypeptidase-like regulatory domain-containing protein [unclassified Aeromicrobium]|jgi:molybdopterin-binding protein|uniref:MSCRAMM family protein n=1 Tax=unclassified Aeromicrobium TaxID=2633570 RepID=UPI000AD277CD|nr:MULTISPECIES: carboxypeptidase-like regulatory domain-containing protein [unclassified Aeromicrobium]